MLYSLSIQLSSSKRVSASRVFSGPTMYPPESFSAYGIFAFSSLPSTEERKRYIMLCEAYLATLPNILSLTQLPTSEQMVTVWPLSTNQSALDLNKVTKIDKKICDKAIDQYGLVTSLQALKDANFSGVNVNEAGPYLLAWSPAKEKGKKASLVLAANFSKVSTIVEAKKIFAEWRSRIEHDPTLWSDGFIAETTRDKLRRLVDDLGPKIWEVFNLGSSLK